MKHTRSQGSFKCTMVSGALHGRCGRFLKQWISQGGSWLRLLSHRSRWQHKVHMTEGEIRLLTTAGTAESVRQTCSLQMREMTLRERYFASKSSWKQTTPKLTFPHFWRRCKIPQLYIYQAFQGPWLFTTTFISDLAESTTSPKQHCIF